MTKSKTTKGRSTNHTHTTKDRVTRTHSICVGHYVKQTNTNNLNKTTGGKNQPNIVFKYIVYIFLSSSPVLSGVRVTRSLVVCVWFVDRFFGLSILDCPFGIL
jgi:hypothetical protein